MKACPKIAQFLYTSRLDKMLRPYYHYLLSTYGFNEESAMVSTKTTDTGHRELTNWNIEFYMEKKKPENNANKVDIAVMVKEKRTW